MTKQEYYDLAVKTSAGGRFPSISLRPDSPRCVYRGENNRACMVGLVIPDSRYMPEMDKPGHNMARFIFDRFRLHDLIPDGITLDQLINCQTLHDGMAGQDWDHATFVKELNHLDCFKDVVRIQP